ncbi:MAG: hypothetical protein JSR76_02975 [Verrucomicrobia bacterium]|nr:hypothetical protein [Verrucomicrobiota bacterium]
MTAEVKGSSVSTCALLFGPKESTWEGRLVGELTPNVTHYPIAATIRKIVLVFLIPLLLITAFARFITRSPEPMRALKQAVAAIRRPPFTRVLPPTFRSALKGGRVAHCSALIRWIIDNSLDRKKACDEFVRSFREGPRSAPKKVSFKTEVKEKIIEKFNVDETLPVFINPIPLTPAEKAAESKEDAIEARTKITEIARKRYLAYQKIARVSNSLQ